MNDQKKETLTQREKEVVDLLRKGLTCKEIARSLFVSEHTVKTHVKNIYRKLEVKTRVELLLKLTHNPG